MKSLLFLSACGLVLAGVSACAPMTPPTARVALDCPTEVGDLRLSTMAPDRKTCRYSTRDGDEVSLRLISVGGGGYQAALQPVETELQGEIETNPPAAAAKGGAVDIKADAKSVTLSAKAASSAAADASAVARQAAEDAKSSVKTSDKDEDSDAKDDADSHNRHGDHAQIDLPGIHINANDDKSNANVHIGGFHVDAGDEGATIRMSRDVRLRGEAFSRERHGFRSTFILARDDLKNGWKAIGYEAAGPKSGPITVAVFKAHEGTRHDVSDDIKRLVRRNGGV
jgi:hypothetical protein